MTLVIKLLVAGLLVEALLAGAGAMIAVSAGVFANEQWHTLWVLEHAERNACDTRLAERTKAWQKRH